MFTTIVTGFDGSDRGLDALALAESLAGPRTQLVVCLVRPPRPRGTRDIAGPAGPDVEDEARERLQLAREQIAERPNTELVTRTAVSPAAGLHDEVQARAADLLVVGSSHRSGLGRVVAGSVTRQAVQAAPCAVAIAPYGLRLRDSQAIAEVGVGFDSGAPSQAALATATTIAQDAGARLRIVSVVDQQLGAAGWSSAWVYPEIRDDLLRLAREDAREAAGTVPAGLESSVDVVEGGAAPELVLASANLDLLVLGSRGYGPVRRTLLGTVSTRVAEHAACPVMIVPRADEASEASEAA